MKTSYSIQKNTTELLAFTGEMVAHRSSALSGKDRWTELTLYFSDADTWILHVVGKSIVPGETDRFRVATGQRAVDVLDLLVTETRLAKHLIGDALDYLVVCDGDDDV